jgi:hypothetical protein
MLTVCSLPDILGSSKSFVRAKGETAVIVGCKNVVNAVAVHDKALDCDSCD